MRATGDLRKPLGVLVSRKLRSEEHAGPVAGEPEGDYMVLQFDTSFAGKDNAVETVTTALDKDERWKVSAYSIK